MDENRPFYYLYASFTKDQLSLLKVAALYFDKLIILDPVSADHHARDEIHQLTKGILQVVIPAAVLAAYERFNNRAYLMALWV